MIDLTLEYEFEGNDYEYDIKVKATDYADYLFDQLLAVKRTQEAYEAVVEMIETLDLYVTIEDYGFLDWLTENYRGEAWDQYECDRDADDVRGLYD